MTLPSMTMRLTADAKRLEDTYITHCLLCRREFKNGDTTHIGYTEDGRALQVGDCCSHFLVETAVRHYFLSRPFDIPPGKTRLWRYMDFSKYVAMIASQTLFFSRLDQLDDPFEGAMGSEDTQETWCNHYLNFFKDGIRNPPPGSVFSMSDQDVELAATRLLNDFRNGNVRKAQTTFVNCWYESDEESDAMWRLYSEQSKYAVAIQTTVGRLRKCTDKQITVGRIRYIDYCKSYPDVSFPHFFKRRSFEHEREVRAVILDMKAEPQVLGKPLDVDLQSLIVGVKVSPLSPSWFLDVVEDATRKYELSTGITVSSLVKKSFR